MALTESTPSYSLVFISSQVRAVDVPHVAINAGVQVHHTFAVCADRIFHAEQMAARQAGKAPRADGDVRAVGSLEGGLPLVDGVADVQALRVGHALYWSARGAARR